MVHLPIYLVDEIKLGAPNHLRWMFSGERNMCRYKGLVRNRRCPDACIAKGCDCEDCLTFSSRYLHNGAKTRFSRYQIEDDEDVKKGDNLFHMFPKIGHPVGDEKKKGKPFTMDLELSFEGHRYILFNTGDDQVEDFIR